MENQDLTRNPAYIAALAFDVEGYFENHSKLKPEPLLETRNAKIKYTDGHSSKEVIATGKMSDLPRTSAGNLWSDGQSPASVTIMWPSMETQEIEAIKSEMEAVFLEWKTDIETRQLISNNPDHVFETAIWEKLKLINPVRFEKCQAGFRLPKSDKYPGELVKMFASVKLAQWANKQVEKATNSKSNREKWSVTRKMWLLKELGFFSLSSIGEIQSLSTQKRNLLLSMLVDEDKENIKKCLNKILKSNLPPDENHRNHKEFVQDYIEKMKGKTPG